MLGLVQAVTAYEILAIEAARTGDRDVALRALVANPLVRQWDLAVPLLDALLEANRRVPAAVLRPDRRRWLTRRSAWTAATPRPTWSSPTPTGGCWPGCAVPGTRSPWREPSTGGAARPPWCAATRARGRRRAAATSAVGAVYFLANVDLPRGRGRRGGELAAARAGRGHGGAQRHARRPARRSRRAGAWRSCPAPGINAVGVASDRATAGSSRSATYTGDCGRRHGRGASPGLGAAVRAGDGRGPATVLRDACRPLRLRPAEDVAIAVHRGEIAVEELHVLAPVVFAAAAAGDAVARRIVDASPTRSRPWRAR